MNQDIEKALDNLKKREQDIQHYINIMSKVKNVNVANDQDFQREFDFFYKVRRNAEWRKVFFEIFEKKKKKNCSYKEILTELYESTGQVEASFASKMLASIEENMPIWDSKVLDRIGIKPSNKRGQQKLEETIELYGVIVKWYSDLKANKASYNEYVTSFDRRFPIYSSISDTKKIDFILWAMDDEEEDTIPSVYIQNMEVLSDAAKIASRSIEAYPGVVSAVKQIADCMKQYQGISQTFRENARRITETIRPIFEYQQQIMESVRPALESLGKTITSISATIPKIEIPESFLKTLGNLRYLYTLKRITWPLFLEDDEELKEIITGLCGDKKENYPLDELATSICNYYTSEKIENIVDGWRELLKDDPERLLLLEEAVNLHNSGFYYGATSIMMCQVDGLICDISNYTDENGLICSEDDEKEICELYQVDFQNHKKFAKKSEKHMILRLAAMTENAVFYWEAITDYIYNVVLTSHGDEYRDHNPFVEDLKDRLDEQGADAKVSVDTVNKLNESYEAVTVTPEGSNIGVNIGIDKFYDAMENGRSYDEVVDKAVEVVNSGITQRPDFDIDSLSDYSQMKEKLAILSQTERLTMNNRPAQPKYARNKNTLVVGGSGSGKTRFFIKPNLLQMHSSYVLTDPKGTVLPEVGNALLKHGYRIKIFNTINFKKSMHYNPFA